MLDFHISTCFNKDTCDLFMLCIELVCQLYRVLLYNCCSIYFVVVRLFICLLFIFCSTFVSFYYFVRFNVHCSLLIGKIFNSDPGLYSRCFDPVVQEIPVTITIYTSQKTQYIRLHHLCLSIGASGILRS
jgi:hypothetical protein